MSTSDHLASWCCTTVLPEPKGPGTAAVPPLAMGNMVSITRWPDCSGAEGVNFLRKGRPTRTGHFCVMVSSRSSPFSVRTRAMIWSIV